MVLNSTSTLHHIQLWKTDDKEKKVIYKNKALRYSMKRKEKEIKEFDVMVNHNETCIKKVQELKINPPRNWFDWGVYMAGIETDEEDFKCHF
eukprot:1286085-Ditylum_brightwellii.AAC.1